MRRAFLGLGLVTLLALGYVQQRVCLVTVGYETEKLRRVKETLLDQNRVLHYNVLILQSPMILDRRLQQREIQLTPPQRVEILVPKAAAQLLSGGEARPIPTWLEKTRSLTVRWLGSGPQAEAEPES